MNDKSQEKNLDKSFGGSLERTPTSISENKTEWISKELEKKSEILGVIRGIILQRPHERIPSKFPGVW